MKSYLKKSVLFLLFTSVIITSCGKDDEETPEPQPQKASIIDKDYFEGNYVYGSGVQSVELGSTVLTNPYNAQMTVAFASNSPFIGASGSGTVYHNETKTLKVFYVKPQGVEEKSIDEMLTVYLHSFGTKDKKDSAQIRVKVTVK